MKNKDEIVNNDLWKTGFCMSLYDDKECEDCPSILDCLKMQVKCGKILVEKIGREVRSSEPTPDGGNPYQSYNEIVGCGWTHPSKGMKIPNPGS